MAIDCLASIQSNHHSVVLALFVCTCCRCGSSVLNAMIWRVCRNLSTRYKFCVIESFVDGSTLGCVSEQAVALIGLRVQSSGQTICCRATQHSTGLHTHTHTHTHMGMIIRADCWGNNAFVGLFLFLLCWRMTDSNESFEMNRSYLRLQVIQWVSILFHRLFIRRQQLDQKFSTPAPLNTPPLVITGCHSRHRLFRFLPTLFALLLHTTLSVENVSDCESMFVFMIKTGQFDCNFVLKSISMRSGKL